MIMSEGLQKIFRRLQYQTSLGQGCKLVDRFLQKKPNTHPNLSSIDCHCRPCSLMISNKSYSAWGGKTGKPGSEQRPNTSPSYFSISNKALTKQEATQPIFANCLLVAKIFCNTVGGYLQHTTLSHAQFSLAAAAQFWHLFS